VFGIEFVAFKLRDMDHNTTLVEIARPDGIPFTPPVDDGDDSSRFVRYDFPPSFLRLSTVGATCVVLLVQLCPGQECGEFGDGWGIRACVLCGQFQKQRGAEQPTGRTNQLISVVLPG
jgi:hypothetical protein